MENKKILLIVPTRNRPQNIPRVIESWRATTSEKSDLSIVIDDDQRELYSSVICDDVYWPVYPNMKLCPKLNATAEFHRPFHHIIGFIGDDIVIKTPGWEERVIEACGEVGMCYPNDTIQGAALPTHIFMTSNIIKTLGYMVPPTFVHLYCDNFWRHLGNSAGVLKYLGDDVIMEHYHPHVGKVATDQQYEETYAGMNRDAAIYQEWVDKQAKMDIEKVIKLKNER
jgi:glycosyltransferase involved in cell wall biosynthesis